MKGKHNIDGGLMLAKIKGEDVDDDDVGPQMKPALRGVGCWCTAWLALAGL